MPLVNENEYNSVGSGFGGGGWGGFGGFGGDGGGILGGLLLSQLFFDRDRGRRGGDDCCAPIGELKNFILDNSTRQDISALAAATAVGFGNVKDKISDKFDSLNGVLNVLQGQARENTFQILNAIVATQIEGKNAEIAALRQGELKAELAAQACDIRCSVVTGVRNEAFEVRSAQQLDAILCELRERGRDRH